MQCSSNVWEFYQKMIYNNENKEVKIPYMEVKYYKIRFMDMFYGKSLDYVTNQDPIKPIT